MSRAATLPHLPVSLVVVDRWIRAGFLRLELPGTGRRRRYPAEEIRAMAALDALRHHGGTDPDGYYLSPPARVLFSTVAELARTNEAGTAHEITTPVPWIRHVLIVPEP